MGRPCRAARKVGNVMSALSKCPKCGVYGVFVMESRHVTKRILNANIDTVRRRRFCKSCKYRYSTYEIDSDKWASLSNIVKDVEYKKSINKLIRIARIAKL